MKKLLVVLMSVFMLVGCGGGSGTSTNVDTPKEGFEFVVNSTTVKMNQDTSEVLSSLGKEISYFEAPSCAFDGLDKTYTYAGYQLITYPNGNKDYVNSIVLKDDTVTTKEGLYIGGSKSSVETTYGTDFEDVNGAYVYTKGDSKLEFIFNGDVIASITYTAITK